MCGRLTRTDDDPAMVRRSEQPHDTVRKEHQAFSRKLHEIEIDAAKLLNPGQKPTVNFDGDGLELASGGSAVQIMCDAGDYPGVLRVCDDLALDFGRVTGTNGSVMLMGDGPAMNASMIFNITGRSTFAMESGAAKGGVIIAGTIGNSSTIDKMISDGKIDVSEIEGEWEAYVSAVVDSPMDGVDSAMVIAGKSP